MTEKITKALSKLSGFKSIGVASIILLIGIFFCLIEPHADVYNAPDVDYEKEIVRLCTETVGQKPYVSVDYEKSGEISGVAVIVDSGDNATVRLKLTEMISTLYALPYSRIYVTGRSVGQ